MVNSSLTLDLIVRDILYLLIGADNGSEGIYILEWGFKIYITAAF